MKTRQLKGLMMSTKPVKTQLSGSLQPCTCRRNERKVPAIVGADASAVEKWGQQTERMLEGGEFGATLLSAAEAG